MAVLLIAEHDNKGLKDATHKALTAAPRWAATCMCWWLATRLTVLPHGCQARGRQEGAACRKRFARASGG
jgi:hypothetical protein